METADLVAGQKPGLPRAPVPLDASRRVSPDMTACQRVVHDPLQEAEGPYLFLGVVALTTKRRGYECVRTAGRVDPLPGAGGFGLRAPGLRDADDDAVDIGQRLLSCRVTMKKSVFELDTRHGPCLPDFHIKARRNGEVRPGWSG